MPAKKTTTKTAPKSSLKTNLAKSSLLKKGRKFDLRIVAVIVAVLVIAIGYLFVRLSKAATEIPCTAPQHAQNCYRLPNDAQATQSGGIVLPKDNGTVSWSGDGGDNLTMTDYVYDHAQVKYCFYVQFTGDYGTRWQIVVNNKTSPIEQTAISGAESGKSPANNPQTVKCTDKFMEAGSGGSAGAGTASQKNEVRFNVSSGSVIVYKMVRIAQVANPDPVTQPAPGGLKPAATPAPAATTNPAGKPVAATPAPTAAQTQAPAATSNPAQKPAATPVPAPPAPAAPQCPEQTTGQGNQGGCVTLIQQRLVNLGYDPGAVDGVFGDKTFSAVKVFQNKNGLTVDGIVGPNTWARLFDPNAARKS